MHIYRRQSTWNMNLNGERIIDEHKRWAGPPPTIDCDREKKYGIFGLCPKIFRFDLSMIEYDLSSASFIRQLLEKGHHLLTIINYEFCFGSMGSGLWVKSGDNEKKEKKRVPVLHLSCTGIAFLFPFVLSLFLSIKVPICNTYIDRPDSNALN